MKGNLHLYYDEEGDFLELQVGEPREGYFEEIKDGVFERRDKKTEEVIGLAIFNVKKRTIRDISLPIKVELTA